MHDSIASVDKIQSALSFVSPHDRDVWVKMAMAIRSELGEEGEWLWLDWSEAADNFNTKAAKDVWKSVKQGKVGIGSLFYEAKQAGWVWDKPERKLSAQEVAAMREASRLKAEAAAAEKAAEQAKAAERAQSIWNASEPATDHPYLTRKQVKAHGLRVGKWEVTNPETGEVRIVSPFALLVPIKDRTGRIHSLQAIFPRKVGERDKDYLKGGAKAGLFHAIGKPQEHDGRKVFVLSEGYATCASIHEATGHCVLVCFDAGNLMPVATAIRERQPDAIILLAADNDQFNKRKDGTQYNPGVEAANKADAEVKGLVAVPQFASLDGQPTDFNDLACREGSDAVALQIGHALTGGVVQPEPEPEPAPPWEGPQTFEQLADEMATDGAQHDSAEIPQKELDEQNHLVKNKYFTILGYDHEEYYFFVHAKQQVLCRKRGDFSKAGLLELANDINWWEMNFPGPKGGVDTDAAFGWVLHVAHSRGVYDPTNTRGRGAWLDDGRSVYHLGDVLLVDGDQTQIDAISSAYVYPRGRKLPRPHSARLTAEEGRRLLEVSSMVRWNMQGSAVLMAGWSFLAPICGALKWRPHIWITGPAGSGKSTVQSHFCRALTRGFSIYGQGDSTEPGVRQALRSDSIPVLLDEMESNDEYEKKRTESILAMMRKASTETGAETLKGTATGDGQNFHVRSMFCLASVNTKLDKQPDIDRVTRLVIRVPPRDGSQIDHWNKLEARLIAIRDDDALSARLIARSLSMMPVIMASVKVFVLVAAKKFNSQRMGDQYGTLIAGCWCLCNDKVATDLEAQQMIDAYDWNEHIEDQDQDDAADALRSILSAKVRMGGSIGDLTVFELIRESRIAYREGAVDQKVADDTLRRHGIRVEEKDDVLLFGTSVPNLKALLKNTAYSTDARGQLLRLPGATRWDNSVLRFNGSPSKCVSVPLSLVFEEPKGPPPSAAAAASVPDDFPI